MNETYIEEFFGYCFYDSFYEEGPIIYNLFVYPEFRGYNNSRGLLAKAIAAIRVDVDSEILIAAVPFNDCPLSVPDLISLYESMGLKVI